MFFQQSYVPWSQVKERVTAPLGTAARKQALTQAAALVLSTQPCSVSATRATLDALADAVDHFLRLVTTTMRTVVDREANSPTSGNFQCLIQFFHF